MSKKPSITVDIGAIQQRFSDDELKAKQAVFAQRVGFDMNERCPEDEGHLRDSMETASDFEGGQIVWDTPYAKRVLNLDSVGTVKNPKAAPQWPEAVKGEKLASWRAMAAGLMSGSEARIGSLE